MASVKTVEAAPRLAATAPVEMTRPLAVRPPNGYPRRPRSRESARAMNTPVRR